METLWFDAVGKENKRVLSALLIDLNQMYTIINIFKIFLCLYDFLRLIKLNPSDSFLHKWT